MKKNIYLLLAVFLLVMPFRADAGKHRSYVIGFYTLENLSTPITTRERTTTSIFPTDRMSGPRPSMPRSSATWHR